MRIVLDTNVLVSGLLSPVGAPGDVLGLVLEGRVTVCLDERIAAEYREVLFRGGWPFSKQAALEVLQFLRDNSFVVTPSRLDIRLPDPDDLMFIEAAAEAGADAIVTGNRRHFPKSAARGISVLSPAEFLETLKRQ